MTTTTLRQAVEDELTSDPRVDESMIAVSANDYGLITLQGTVGSPRQKIEAGRAAQRVRGVVAVTNELEVRILNADRREDAELRGAVLQALRLNSMVPATIDAQVERGMVTLTGKAQWHYQRDEAEGVAGNVPGVRGVISQIVLQPVPNVTDIRQSIREAFQRDATIDADSITVQSNDGAVTVSGFVSSWAAHNAAINAAWSAPGVVTVNDHLEVRY